MLPLVEFKDFSWEVTKAGSRRSSIRHWQLGASTILEDGMLLERASTSGERFAGSKFRAMTGRRAELVESSQAGSAPPGHRRASPPFPALVGQKRV